MTFSVYMHQNPVNNKVYIGITSQKVERRWKNGLGYNESPLFKKAIDKYGWNNLNHIVLYENLTKEEAETKEIELIKLFKSNQRKYGYNIQNGGSVNLLSKKSKEKIRQAKIGKKATLETRLKMSKSQKGIRRCLGYKHTEKTKQKHREHWLGEKNCRAKKVNQYDLNGNLLKSFNYMEEIKKELNIKSTCHISDCCRGIRHKSHGYIWKYAIMEVE